MHQPKEAIESLLLASEEKTPSEISTIALSDALNAAYQIEDELSLSLALDHLEVLQPRDPCVAKGYLARAALHKKAGRAALAREDFQILTSRFPDTEEAKTALFEQIALEAQEKNWSSCRALCKTYLDRFAQNENASFVWSHLAAASSHLAYGRPDAVSQEQLAFDIESLLRNNPALSPQERSDWLFLLAKTNYDLGCYEEAIRALTDLSVADFEFGQKANVRLLLAFCYRDGFSDLLKFCNLASDALAAGANLLDEASIRLSLFNAYLGCSNTSPELLESAAEHLYLASALQPVQPNNLLWLADFYFEKSQEPSSKRSLYAERAAYSMEQFLSSSHILWDRLEESTAPFEPALVKLAELFGVLNQKDKQLALLKSLHEQRKAHPDWPWNAGQ